MELAKLSMPFGCFAKLRSLSHYLQLRQPSFGQLLVSFIATSFFWSFVRLHYTSFVARYLFQGMAHYPPHKAKAHVMHIPFHKASPTILTGFHFRLHYVLHSFQQHSVHSLPIILRAFLACCGFGFVMAIVPNHNA